MNNLPLQPLVWIEKNHPNGVYFEKTNSYIKAAICFCSTLVTDYVIRHDNDTGMYVVNYGGRTENEYHTLEEAKEWCEFTHYASKMQPYVKPTPTWIDTSEQLPQVDVDTQFICAYDSAIDTFSKVVWFNADIGKFDYRHDDVLAWMPIPEFSTMQNLHKGE